MFEIFVVYESGPIMKKTFAFIQDNYKRLSHPQRAAFTHALITKYLSNIDNLASMRVTEKYSPLKIVEKLQHFELLIANLFAHLENTQQKTLKVLLVKLIVHELSERGVGHLELYSTETGKYVKNMSLKDLVEISFKNCLWMLSNISALKEQVLGEALDLLLMFVST